MRKPEILAPAGDFEKLRYAIMYGADAVYLAMETFGMRAAAGNFDRETLPQAVEFAHARGVKVYVTVNIMPHNSDLPDMPEFFAFLNHSGVDALIIADVGVLMMAKEHAPKLSIHISTQTSITNYQAARFWHSLGAERIVLARELSLEEIKTIRDNTPKELQIEAFVHGAMCMSYSGRCLISNYLTGRDANKGACAQPCRWKYKVMEETRPGEFFPIEEDERGTYLFNSKDLCMIDHIPELVAAGIDSFKIEGRAKTAYYAAGVVSAYKSAVDAYFAAPEGFVLPKEIKEEIRKVSHRNYSKGFYFGRDPEGQFYEDAHYIRDWDIAAQFVSCDPEGNAVFSQKNRFYVGDTLELMRPNEKPFVFVVEHLSDMAGNALEVARHPTQHIRIKLPFQVGEYSILRRERPEEQGEGSH